MCPITRFDGSLLQLMNLITPQIQFLILALHKFIYLFTNFSQVDDNLSICQINNRKLELYRPAESRDKLIKQWTAGVVSEDTRLVFLTIGYVDDCHLVCVTTTDRQTDR